MFAPIRPRISFVAGVGIFGISPACGHLGLDTLVDDEPSVTQSGGQTAGDGDGDGEATGGMQDGTGGAALPTGGTFSFGGLAGGGGLGGGGAFEVPSIPCTFACPDPFLLYQNFEDGLPLFGIVEDEGATVELSTERVHRDEFSLCATQGLQGTDAQITERINRVVGAHIYYRAWMFVPQGAVTDWLKVLAFNGIATEGIDVNLTAARAAEIHSQMTSQTALSPEGVVPEGEWFCLRTTTFVDNVNGSIELSINDQTVLRVESWDTLPGPEIDNIVYGIAETGAEQTGATVCFDDILASTEPITCTSLF